MSKSTREYGYNTAIEVIALYGLEKAKAEFKAYTAAGGYSRDFFAGWMNAMFAARG